MLLTVEGDERTAELKSDSGVDCIASSQAVLRGYLQSLLGKGGIERDKHNTG
jgi:hypothetical protein